MSSTAGTESPPLSAAAALGDRRVLRRAAFWTVTAAALLYALWCLVASTSWISRPFAGFVVDEQNRVDLVTMAEWSGPQAGLLPMDRIVEMDGRPVHTPSELYAYVAERPIGTPVRYVIDRGGDRLTHAIATQHFGPRAYFILFFSNWAIGVLHLLLGVLVSLKRPGHRAAQAHLLFCFSVGLFCIGDFLVITEQPWVAVPATLASCGIGASGFLLGLRVPRETPLVRRHPWLETVSLALVAAIPLLYAPWTVAGNTPDWAFLALVAYACAGGAFVPAAALWARLSRTSTRVEREQARIVLWGSGLGFVPVIADTALSLAGLNLPYHELAYMLLVLFPAAIALSIVRHAMFDIRFILKRTLTYTVVAGLLLAAYFLLALGLRALFAGLGEASEWLATAFVVIAFVPLHRAVQGAMDRLFFRSGYDFEAVTTSFGEQAREIHLSPALIALYAEKVEGALHPRALAVLVAQGDRLAPARLDGLDTLSLSLEGAGPDLLSAQPSWEPAGWLGLPEATRLPLVAQGETIGCVLVGPRKSDQAYGAEDRALLLNLTQQLAVCLKSAQLFEQLAARADELEITNRTLVAQAQALYAASTERERQQAELNRIGREMEIAQRIQTALLPRDLSIRGFELALEMRPADEVGGDMIDYMACPDGTFWLAVGDVTGHGLTSGLVMMMAQSLFTGLVHDTPGAGPADLLARLNRSLYNNLKYRLESDAIMTLQLIRHLGEGRFLAAGHHLDLLIWRAAAGRVERLSPDGTWLGVAEDIAPLTTETPFDLAPGDVLLAYTDGLIEAMDAAGAQFDVPRLEALFACHAAEPAAAIKAHVLAAHAAWVRAQTDDVSLIVLKRALPDSCTMGR